MADNIYIKVNYSDRERVTRQRDPDEQWDGDDTEHDIHVNGIKPGTAGDFDVIVKGPKQRSYYLVWARYGTGDSFSKEDGCITFIHACKTRQDAEFLLSKVEQSGRQRKDSAGSTSVKLPSGDNCTFYTVWNGYFESFEGAEFEAFDLR
jgi:hypothetical protein